LLLLLKKTLPFDLLIALLLQLLKVLFLLPVLKGLLQRLIPQLGRMVLHIMLDANHGAAAVVDRCWHSPLKVHHSHLVKIRIAHFFISSI
jgi:hypothetical protein